jgi:hypothetical protein
VIGFIDHLQIVTISNYSAVANLHTVQFTTEHTKSSLFVFASRFLVKNPSSVLCLRPYWLANVSQLTRVRVRLTLRLASPYFFSLTHGAEPFLRSCHFCSHSRTSQGFMEPEGSLPCPQEPSTGPSPEPDQSTPYHPILSLWDHILLTFQVPNLISIFFRLGRLSKESVQVRGFLRIFVTSLFFTVSC